MAGYPTTGGRPDTKDIIPPKRDDRHRYRFVWDMCSGSVSRPLAPALRKAEPDIRSGGARTIPAYTRQERIAGTDMKADRFWSIG